MNDEILKLAGECGVLHISEPAALEAFHRAVFNAGLEAAAKVCEETELEYGYDCSGTQCAAAIRALEMK